jgi:hypothetical protein
LIEQRRERLADVDHHRLPKTERRSACWAIFFYFFVIAGGAI